MLLDMVDLAQEKIASRAAAIDQAGEYPISRMRWPS
jgi:hypothetical protein